MRSLDWCNQRSVKFRIQRLEKQFNQLESRIVAAHKDFRIMYNRYHVLKKSRSLEDNRAIRKAKFLLARIEANKSVANCWGKIMQSYRKGRRFVLLSPRDMITLRILLGQDKSSDMAMETAQGSRNAIGRAIKEYLKRLSISLDFNDQSPGMLENKYAPNFKGYK